MEYLHFSVMHIFKHPSKYTFDKLLQANTFGCKTLSQMPWHKIIKAQCRVVV